MRLRICIFFIIILLYDESDASEKTKQEAAKVVYWNPKYLKEMKIFTSRHSRHSPYLTSSKCTTLHPWDNNITLQIECYSSRTKQLIFGLEFKLCDIIEVSWAKEWVKQYSNVPTHCAILPGTYIFKEIELPPKNFPIPLTVAGDYTAGLTFVTTKEKEKIIELKVNLKL